MENLTREQYEDLMYRISHGHTNISNEERTYLCDLIQHDWVVSNQS